MVLAGFMGVDLFLSGTGSGAEGAGFRICTFVPVRWKELAENSDYRSRSLEALTSADKQLYQSAGFASQHCAIHSLGKRFRKKHVRR